MVERVVKLCTLLCGLVVLSAFLTTMYLRSVNDGEIAKEVARREVAWRQKHEDFIMKEANIAENIEKLDEQARAPFKGRSLITDSRLVQQEYEPSDRHAFVTMFGSTSYVHSYWMGALAVVQSLREVQTRVPHLVVMTRNMELIPPSAVAAFSRLGAEIIEIESIDLLDHVEIPGTWAAAFDKLRVWSLTQFDKVVFLDADTLIVQNIDHLFHEPELTAPYTPTNCQCNVEYHSNPIYFTISSGFFVCEPSDVRFNQIVELANNPSPDPADQEQFGGNWHWGDQEMLRVLFKQLAPETGAEWHPLEWEYDLPVGLCSCPMRRTRPVYSYHFVCTFPISKPWSIAFPTLFDVHTEAKPCVMEIYLLWFRMFLKAMNPHSVNLLDEVMLEDDTGDAAVRIEPGQNRVVW